MLYSYIITVIQVNSLGYSCSTKRGKVNQLESTKYLDTVQ